MKAVWGLLVLLGLIQVVLLLMGVGVGFLLCWVIPDLGIGTAVLVGAMCSISSGVFLVLFSQLLPGVHLRAAQEDCDADEDEDEDEEERMEFEDIEIRAVRPRSRAGRQHRSRRR